MAKNGMFQVGDKVIYPNHGVGVVDQISTRANGFMAESYYNLTIVASSLKVMVPCRNADAVGLRRMAEREEIDRVLAYLGEAKQPIVTDWRDRYREYCEKMKTGSLMETAEVMKSLLVQNSAKALGERDAKLLERTRHLMRNEIALGLGCSEAEVETLVLAAARKGNLEFPVAVAED